PVSSQTLGRRDCRIDARACALLKAAANHRGRHKKRAAHGQLHRHGYMRVVTTSNGGLPPGQCDLALVDWRAASVEAVRLTFASLVHFPSPAGVLVIWVDPQDRAANRKLRLILENHGLLVEAGTIREHGSAISARRRELSPISKAA